MAKILVVDDNEQLNSMLKDVLESWGHEVLLAVEGMEGLDSARTQRPDIILLDIMLPGFSGYEVCSQLKKDPATRNIAIVMMTALADTESRIHGYKVGADNFLVKPINYDEVHAIMNKLIEDKRIYDTMEQRCNVASFLQKMMLILPDSAVTELPTQEQIYCDKVLESLNWSRHSSEQARIASMMVPIVEIVDRYHLDPDHIFTALHDLTMCCWLEPVLQFLTSAPVERDGLRETLAERKCQPAAELALIVSRYVKLLKENNLDKELAISIMKREAIPNKYNKEILKSMEEIIQAEQILENIQL